MWRGSGRSGVSPELSCGSARCGSAAGVSGAPETRVASGQRIRSSSRSSSCVATAPAARSTGICSIPCAKGLVHGDSKNWSDQFFCISCPCRERSQGRREPPRDLQHRRTFECPNRPAVGSSSRGNSQVRWGRPSPTWSCRCWSCPARELWIAPGFEEACWLESDPVGLMVKLAAWVFGFSLFQPPAGAAGGPPVGPCTHGSTLLLRCLSGRLGCG